MTDAPATQTWRDLRIKFLLRSMVPMLAIVWFAAYLISVAFQLGRSELFQTLLVIVPIVVVVNATIQQSLLVGWLCRSAVTPQLGDGAGARLERILALPRKLELYAMLPSYATGGVVFSTLCCAWFDKPYSLVPVGTGITISIALLIGLPTTLLFQDDVLPLAVAEHHRNPQHRPTGGGATWTRKSWFLPYSFSVLILCVGISGAVVMVRRFAQERSQLVAEVGGLVSADATTRVAERLDAMALEILVPLGVILGAILAMFIATGWLMARRERRAGKAIDDSLRSMVAGTPQLPNWIGTDEVGDVAFSVSAVNADMQKIFAQLGAMASGSLSVQLEGDSGLITAFRASQLGLIKLSNQMQSLARGDSVTVEGVVGDLGISFRKLGDALGATIAQAKTIAAGDLRRDMDGNGDLASAIHLMTQKLRSMVGQTQDVGSKISDIVVSLRAASAQLSTATTEQVSALAETANTMTEMSQTSAASADRCAELIRQGESAAAVVDRGRSGASDAGRAMNAISASLGKVSSLSSALSEKVQQVDGIIETVGFLADQSSTLAINAGIEASRAGEAGKGFSAVAREMRALASDSRKATAQIREILQEIRQKTVQVDSSVAAGSSTVDDGVRLVHQLGDAIGQLGVTIHDAVGLMRQVEGSARQHQAGVGQVSQALRSMQAASESIRDGARLLSGLSEQAHSLSTMLKQTSGAYQLPAKNELRDTPGSNGSNGGFAPAHS